MGGGLIRGNMVYGEKIPFCCLSSNADCKIVSINLFTVVFCMSLERRKTFDA